MILYTHTDEDGDLLIEFADEERRLGIMLGEESGWYHISKDGEHCQLESLPKGFLDKLAVALGEILEGSDKHG